MKIAALVKLREELERLLPELSADAERAASLNALYETLRRRVGPERTAEAVAAVRTAREAAQGSNERATGATAGGPLGHRERLLRLTQTAEQLMAPEATEPSQPGGSAEEKLVGLLRQRLALEQEATAPTLAAARLGAEALGHAEELQQVVAELARIAEAEGIPVRRPSDAPVPLEPREQRE